MGLLLNCNIFFLNHLLSSLDFLFQNDNSVLVIVNIPFIFFHFIGDPLMIVGQLFVVIVHIMNLNQELVPFLFKSCILLNQVLDVVVLVILQLEKGKLVFLLQIDQLGLQFFFIAQILRFFNLNLFSLFLQFFSVLLSYCFNILMVAFFKPAQH